MDKTEIRLVAIELLAWIKENIDDSAIIAGGFARDILLGEEVKDLDIWVKTPIKKAQFKPIRKYIDRLIFINKLNDTRLIQLTKFKYKNVDVDIIVVAPEYIPEGENATCTFDFGICQAWTEDGVVFKGTDLFNNDIKNNCITYNRTDYNDARLERIVNNHLPRLLAKNPLRSVEGLPIDIECNVEDIVNKKKEVTDQLTSKIIEFVRTHNTLIKMADKRKVVAEVNRHRVNRDVGRRRRGRALGGVDY